MYSIKPGRGPSIIGAVAALVIGVPFVIFWISQASQMGAPGFFIFFGFGFLVLLLVQIGKGFYNATSANRVSEFDITTQREETDPFDRLAPGFPGAGPASATAPFTSKSSANCFCPFCGTELARDFRFCPKCGKPQEKSS
jgi:hypothetical protein